jgi:hypothetical protein
MDHFQRDLRTDRAQRALPHIILGEHLANLAHLSGRFLTKTHALRLW